jgi:hypothetical protein
MQLKDKIQQLIDTCGIEKAIADIMPRANKNQREALTLLISRWEENMNKAYQNSITFPKVMAEKTAIINDILKIVDDIEATEPVPTVTKTYTIGIKKLTFTVSPVTSDRELASGLTLNLKITHEYGDGFFDYKKNIHSDENKYVQAEINCFKVRSPLEKSFVGSEVCGGFISRISKRWLEFHQTVENVKAEQNNELNKIKAFFNN